MGTMGKAALLLAVLALLASACWGGEKETASISPATLASTPTEAVKPKPVILGISATTSGMFEDYYAVLEVAIKNEGADGMIILLGSITQANETAESELLLYLAHNVSENVKIVLPLKWRGGDWTPSVVAEIP